MKLFEKRYSPTHRTSRLPLRKMPNQSVNPQKVATGWCTDWWTGARHQLAESRQLLLYEVYYLCTISSTIKRTVESNYLCALTWLLQRNLSKCFFVKPFFPILSHSTTLYQMEEMGFFVSALRHPAAILKLHPLFLSFVVSAQKYYACIWLNSHTNKAARPNNRYHPCWR